MTEHTCPRCNGSGRLDKYDHIRSGVCFKCGGTGKVSRKERKNAAPRPRDEAKVAERKALVERAMNDERVWNSPRMTVAKDHPYAQQHAIEVYQWHERWGW